MKNKANKQFALLDMLVDSVVRTSLYHESSSTVHVGHNGHSRILFNKRLGKKEEKVKVHFGFLSFNYPTHN